MGLRVRITARTLRRGRYEKGESMRKRLRRGLSASLLAALLGFGAFARTGGSENVRAVQMLALLATGMGLGVALMHVRLLMALKPDEQIEL